MIRPGDTIVTADSRRLAATRSNAALGNKICHLLFLISLCERHNAKLAVPIDSNLDEVFDLRPYKRREMLADGTVKWVFVEKSAFRPRSRLGQWLLKHGVKFHQSIADAVRSSREQFEGELAFLVKPLPAGAVSVRGHFWHYALMPSQAAFEHYAPVRTDVREQVLRQYPDLDRDDCVAVHLRESDFRSHLRHVFSRSIMLDDDYYHRAMDAAENQLGKRLRYHLFSDNLERIARVFRGKDHVLHRDPAAVDWTALHLARNVIQSNSTFCWTACLYNKRLSIQPAGGYNYLDGSGDIPFGFRMPFSRVIAARSDQESLA